MGGPEPLGSSTGHVLTFFPLTVCHLRTASLSTRSKGAHATLGREELGTHHHLRAHGEVRASCRMTGTPVSGWNAECSANDWGSSYWAEGMAVEGNRLPPSCLRTLVSSATITPTPSVGESLFNIS